ncbi:hypothetical protein LLE81_00030 [Staphylococcus epidermidis]|nr:hypothetical protein [Staphylococcus epidermidis]
MDSRIGTVVSTIDVATEGIRAIKEMEDLVTRAINVSNRQAELHALLRQALLIGMNTRAMLAFEQKEAQRQLAALQAEAGAQSSAPLIA